MLFDTKGKRTPRDERNPTALKETSSGTPKTSSGAPKINVWGGDIAASLALIAHLAS